MTEASPARPHARAIDEWLGEHADGLIALRRRMHAHPELSGEEYATTQAVAERLEIAGLPYHSFSIGTGLSCDLDVPGSDRRLVLRADLDALAMQDQKDVPYRSRVDGVAHACGHDVHTTIALGTLLYFAHRPAELPGSVRFIFQPAEERVPGGALDVLRDGALDGADAIVGLHCEPKLDVGIIGLRRGPMSSAADMASIELRGPGGHTARPELTVDLITVAARVISELPGRVAELLGSSDVRVVFGAIRAGDAANAIPTDCEIRASIRTPSNDVWDKLPDAFERALEDVLTDTGAEHRLDYTHGVPPVANDPQLTDVVGRAAVDEFGEQAVAAVAQSWGGDDFAWYTREVPGSYVRLGVHDPADPVRLDLHAGLFDVDERSIPIGVRLLVATVHEYFR